MNIFLIIMKEANEALISAGKRIADTMIERKWLWRLFCAVSAIVITCEIFFFC